MRGQMSQSKFEKQAISLIHWSKNYKGHLI